MYMCMLQSPFYEIFNFFVASGTHHSGSHNTRQCPVEMLIVIWKLHKQIYVCIIYAGVIYILYLTDFCDIQSEDS